jgi:hypothetical protein
MDDFFGRLARAAPFSSGDAISRRAAINSVCENRLRDL